MTTIQISYTPPTSNINAAVPDTSTGERQKLIAEKLYDMVNAEVCDEHTLEPPSVDYNTTTHLDYSKGVEGTYLTYSIPDFRA